MLIGRGTVTTGIKQDDHRRAGISAIVIHLGLASRFLGPPSSLISLKFNIFIMLFPLLVVPLLSCPPSKFLFFPSCS